MKRILKLTMMLLLVAFVQVNAQKVGEPAPGFEVGLLGGDTLSLSDHDGKVVAVFFFGNTCPSCKAVGSVIESSIHQEFLKDSMDFIMVGIDTWDSSSNEKSVAGFKNATGITFPLGIKGGNVAVAYKSTYDRLLIIDKAGTLVHKGLVVASNDIDNAIKAIEEGLTVTGVEDLSSENCPGVYPNPASNVVHVKAGEELISGITLFDLSGKKVRESVLNSGNTHSDIEVDLSDLYPGVYFYSIQTGGSSQTGKLLIQK
ncbi:MAG: T9SS type A sorting domain-containing protein [Bacteroidota bacterium]